MASSAAKLATACAELGLQVGGAKDSCALAWDFGDRPTIAAAAGRCEEVLGLPPARLLGLPAGDLISGGERAARDLAWACKDEPAAEERTLLRRGQPFPALLLLRKCEGGVLCLVRDLRAAAALSDGSRRAQDLARFASLVAHEVRNPLSAVKIALQTLERHGTLAANDRRRISIAHREVGNIELLLNEVLEFARPPTLSLVPGDPRAPIEEGVAAIEAEWKERGVSFKLELPERMSPVTLDPTRVRSCVKILCRQAAVAAEEVSGGVVQVSARELPGTGWELRVLDPGRTLPQELRDQAFVPFTPNRARGSGLGLAVVARIADEHGGSATLSPGPAGGNVVAVVFGR